MVTSEKDFRTIQDLVREISKAEFAAMKKEDVIAERKIAKGITSDTFFRTTVLTGSAADESDSFYIGAVARNRSLWKITGKMEFHSTYKQNGRHILKIELDAKGVEEFERTGEGAPDSTLYLFSRGSFKLSANPRFGPGTARSAGAAGAAGEGTSRASSSSDYPLSPSRRQEYLLPTIRFPVATPSGSVPSTSSTPSRAPPSVPIPKIVVTPAPSSKRQRHKSSPSSKPLPDENEPLDAMETSATADDPADQNPPVSNNSLTEPSDKRSRKSDDEASVDSEVQEAAKGLAGGESEDLLREAPEEVRAPEDTNPPK